MIQINKISIGLALVIVAASTSCNKDDNKDSFDTSGTYTQNDQMARPAINTVFVGSARKNEFNLTTPAAMSAAFKADFVAKLTAFGYSSNILGLNTNAFADALVTDVLNVKP